VPYPIEHQGGLWTLHGTATRDDLANGSHEGQHAAILLLGTLRTQPDHTIMDIAPFQLGYFAFPPAGVIGKADAIVEVLW
jgi:hypothetical protein